ncbi:ClpP/crotonase-like domain-containing protein [Cladochytrium replicatum]|nr:ClpP/crotonase-like domain-containing protein [Cladochytrium replicatum]
MAHLLPSWRLLRAAHRNSSVSWQCFSRRNFTASGLAFPPPEDLIAIKKLFLSTRPSSATDKVHLQTSFAKGVAKITLSNPRRKNALSPAMMVELSQCVDALERSALDNENDLCAVILTGDDSAFCSGFDLSADPKDFLRPGAGAAFSALMHDTLARFSRLPMISIAAVEGFAIGGGAELTLACDAGAIASNAFVRFVQAHMGVVPGWGGATRLKNLVGHREALRLLTTALKLKPAECVRMGIMSTVADGRSAVDEAVALAREMTHDDEGGALDPRVVRAMKRAVVGGKEVWEAEETRMGHEREVFKGVWGAEANLKAVSHRKKHR